MDQADLYMVCAHCAQPGFVKPAWYLVWLGHTRTEADQAVALVELKPHYVEAVALFGYSTWRGVVLVDYYPKDQGAEQQTKRAIAAANDCRQHVFRSINYYHRHMPAEATLPGWQPVAKSLNLIPWIGVPTHDESSTAPQPGADEKPDAAGG